MKKLDILFALIVAFVWGSNYISLKYTIIEIPGLLSIAIRFTITAIVTLPFVSLPNRANFQDLYITSLVMGIFYLGLLYFGMHLGLNTTLTIIVMQLNIPISVLIARFALKEHFSLSSAIGIIVAFIGMIIVVGSPHLNGNYQALIVIIFSSIFCAMFNIQSRKLSSIPPITLLCWMNLIAAPHLYIMSYFLEGNPLNLIQGTTMTLWAAILYTALVSSIIGVGLWIYLLQKYPVYKVTPFHLLVPLFGVSLSIIMLGDELSWHIYVGGIITLLGIALSQQRVLPYMVNKRL